MLRKERLYVKFRDGEYRTYGPFDKVDVDATNEQFFLFIGDGVQRIWVSRHDTIFIDIHPYYPSE